MTELELADTSCLDTTGLLEPQIPHAINLLNSLYLNGISSDTSETGTGKTYVGAWISKQFNCPVYVICPKSVMPDWDKILKRFNVPRFHLLNYEKIMRGGTPYVTYREPAVDPVTGKKKEEARCNLVQVNIPDCSLIILDESHKCNGIDSLNSGLPIALKRQGYKVHTISATQAVNVVNMKAYGFAANLHELHDWKKWCVDFGAEMKGKHVKFNSDDEQSQKKMTMVHENLFHVQKIASRLTRESMGNLFPENQIVAQSFDLGDNSDAVRRVYEEMEAEIERLIEQTEGYSGHIFAEMIKARRRSEMLKIPLMQEMVEDLYEEGKSVAVFLNFAESIEALSSRLSKRKRFKNKIGFVHGGQSFKERWKDVEEFQADKKRILICNLKAGGIALSFHDLNGKHPRSSLLSPSFSAIDIMQALGRIHRQGAKTKCYQRIVFAAGCIEEESCRRVQSRLNNLSCLVDGDLTAGIKFFN